MGVKIGITGGIGTGKSAACAVFKSLGIPIYDADFNAKWLMENNKDLIDKIKNLLSSEAYTSENKLNKSFVAKQIFSSDSLKEQLEALVHPAVAIHFDEWSKNQTTEYVLKEAALTYETGDEANLDAVIVVDAPWPIRLDRIIKRDQSTPLQAEARRKAQMSQSKKVTQADYILLNDKSLNELEAQVKSLDKQIREEFNLGQ
jgi:dephospho-CoA kinase